MAVTVFLASGAWGSGGQFFTSGGAVLNAGTIDTYAAGTTTRQAAYTTSAGSVQHANPIVLTSDGRVPAGGEIWFQAGLSYKLVLSDSVGNVIGTYDNLYSTNDPLAPNAQQPIVLSSVAGTNILTASAPSGFTLAGNKTVVIVPPNTNTAATTINITPLGGSALGAVNIFAGNSALVGGELRANIPVLLFYDGTQYQTIGSIFKQPTRTVLTSGSATYTTPTGATRLLIRMIGGGAGGGGSTGGGGAGGNTTFGTLAANGAQAQSNISQGSPGGTATGGDINIRGSSGQPAGTGSGNIGAGGDGAGSAFGGAGSGGDKNVSSSGGDAGINSGSGGGGYTDTGTGASAGGGGAGGYVEKLIVGPAASYAYAVGSAGAAGTGAAGKVGGAGAAGIIIVDEYYN